MYPWGNFDQACEILPGQACNLPGQATWGKDPSGQACTPGVDLSSRLSAERLCAPSDFLGPADDPANLPG